MEDQFTHILSQKAIGNILWPLIIILLFNTVVISQYSILEFNETQSGFSAYNVKTYGDGTVLVQMISNKLNVSTNANTTLNCTLPILSFRILYPNGSINSIIIESSGIPDFNFCQINIDGISDYYIQVYPLANNFIFTTYLNSSDPKNAYVYGLLISFNGSIISTIYLHEAYANEAGNIQPPGSIYYSKYIVNVGFLYVGLRRDTGDVMWSHFTTPHSVNDYKINRVHDGIIPNVENRNTTVRFSAFPNSAGGYSLIVSRVSNDNNNITNQSSTPPTSNPINVRLLVEAFLIFPYGAGITVPSLIYSNPSPNLNVLTMTCNVDYSGGGNVCQLYLVQNQNTFALKIIYLSSGSVMSIKVMQAANTNNADDVKISPLIHGGYLLTVHDHRSMGIQTINGYILNATGDIISNWTLPQPLIVASRGLPYDLLPNDTIVSVAPNSTDRYLRLAKTSLAMFSVQDIYSNPQINTTFPKINQVIPMNLREINITYQNSIALSSQNMSIYKFNNNTSNILRQTYSARSGLCSISKDQKTVLFNVFESTFNEPSTTYYVLIDPNFVTANSTGEPLLGVQSGIWIMTTAVQTTSELFSDSITGLIRLTVNGTQQFEQLSSSDKKNFLNELCKELASVIPTSSSRLIPMDRYERDPNTPEPQIQLALTITSTSDISQRNSFHIYENLNTLIINRDYTSLSLLKHTQYIDSTYAFTRATNIWKDHKDIIIAFIIVILSLFLFFALAYRLNPQAQNSAVFRFALLFISFGLNVAFTFKNARYVYELYTPSLAILVFSFAFKEAFGVFLIIREAQSNIRFSDWFQNRVAIITIFTLLSGIDIYALIVVSSKLCGLEILSAPISEKAKTGIFWAEFASFFIKDIPQFVIQ
ncbi:1419_t:CDS:10, partial [Scutellospora calospora]